MRDDSITFSIVICTYNGCQTIEKTLLSVFEQTYNQEKFEVIVVNDGSTDSTDDVLKKYNIKLVSHPNNMGIAESRNDGLNVARGKYLVCLDDDCTINPRFLQTVEDAYGSEKVMGVAADLILPTNSSMVDKYFSSIWYGVAVPKENTTKTSIFSRFIWYYKNAPWDKTRKHYKDKVELVDVPAACASYKVKRLKQIGGWDNSLRNSSEDNDLSIRLLKSYPDERIILAINAKVTHFQNLTFWESIKRDFLRRDSKISFYKKYHKFPSIFPNPLVFIISLLLLIHSPYMLIAIPLLLYPWWIFRFIKELDVRFLTFPYLQLIQETGANITILLTLKAL